MELEIAQNKVRKFFISQQEAADSFSIELSKDELQSISIKELLEKANTLYGSKHKYCSLDKIQNQIGKIFQEDQNELLKNSHFNLFPFYFYPKKSMFELDVHFQEEIHHFELLINETQKNLLDILSNRLKLDKNVLYFLNESQILKNKLSSYSSVNLCQARDKIFYDDKEIFVDFNLKIIDNIQLFNFANRTDIYKGNQLISKEQTFKDQGIQDADKLSSFFLMKARIKDIETEIKNNFTKQEARELYSKYFPEEKGRLVTEKVDDVLNIRLCDDSEYALSIKTLTGASYDLGADGNDTVEKLKQKLSTLNGVDVEYMTIIYAGKQLNDKQTLQECGIKDDATLHLIYKQGAIFKKIQKQQNLSADSEIQINIKSLTGQSLSVKCKLNNTVLWLKQQIKDWNQIDVSQQRLIYGGSILEDNQLLSEYNLEQECVIHLVYAVKQTKDKQNLSLKQKPAENKFIHILVKTLTGKQIEIKCKLYDTVEMFKNQVQDSEGIPPDQQRLIFSGEQLEDDCSLYMYDINDGATINLVLRLRGGGCAEEKKLFVDLENEKSKKEVSFSNYAPNYRIATDGLNIEAICRYVKCRYYQKQIIIKIGYDSVEIISDNKEKIICPGCQYIPQLVTCGFVNCQYSWCGIKLENEVERVVQSKILKARFDKYTTYDPIKENGESNMVEWKQLYIYATQIDNLEYPKCFICLRKIFYEDDITHQENCKDFENHKCHIDCLQKLDLLEKNCLLCLNNF